MTLNDIVFGRLPRDARAVNTLIHSTKFTNINVYCIIYLIFMYRKV